MNRYRLFVLLIIFNLLVFNAGQVSLSYGSDLSPTIKKRPLTQLAQGEAGYLKLYAKLSVGFYRKVISPIDGDRCKMQPTCSLYSYRAYEEFGFFWGTLLTFDRLLHEANEYTVSPAVYSEKHIVRGKRKLLTYDPLENNVFWWDSKRSLEGE